MRTDLIGEDAPGSLRAVLFPSSGEMLLARLFVPAGRVTETVVLLHGFPGVDLNFDLAHDLRRAGYLVFLPHYRGSWGMPGRYSFAHVVEDVTASVAHLRSDAFVQQYGAAGAITLVGHSLGGFAGLQAGTTPEVTRVAAMAAFNFGAFAASQRSNADALAQTARDWDGEVFPLRGTSAHALAEEALAAPAQWSLDSLAAGYKNKAVMLICAEHDEVAPPAIHHDAVVDAFRGAGVRLVERSLATDHSFASVRLELSRCLLAWLAQGGRLGGC